MYDLIIVGAGPAGLTAGIYAGRYLLKTLIIGKMPGGMISEANKVCNFPSYENISGFELATKMVEQVQKLGVKIEYKCVEEIKKDGLFNVKAGNQIYKAKKIILATGTEKKSLGISGEKKFLGKGVSYCATCDASFYKDKTVTVVGGSDAALTAALLLAEYAKKVYILYRKEKFFRGDPSWIKKVEENKKIEVLFNSELNEICGDQSVENIILNNNSELAVEGVFIEIGSVPDDILQKQLKLKMEKEYVVVDKDQRTNVKGIFAAGDMTNNPLKQVVTACGEGAIAANSVYNEIQKSADTIQTECDKN